MKDKIIYFLKQMVLTLTPKESRLSQKKILIYTIELSMLSITFIYLYKHIATMTASDLCMIVGMWLVKGISNVVMSQNEKKRLQDDSSTDLNTTQTDPTTNDTSQ